MYNYNTYHLIDVEGTSNLVEAIHNLSEANLIYCFGKTILERGRRYYHQGLVNITDYNVEEVTAEVDGSYSYETKIFLDKSGSIQGKCSCPYDAACKHLAALMLEADDLALEEVEVRSIAINNEKVLFEDLLGKYTQAELVEFLLQHATPEQRQILFTQKQPDASFKADFNLIRTQFEDLIEHADLDFSILRVYLDLLKKRWLDVPLEIAQLLHASIGVLQETISEKGAFSHNFVNHYYELELDQYVADFLMAISAQDLQKVLPAFWFMAQDTEVAHNLLERWPAIFMERWPTNRSLKVLKNTFFTDDLLEDVSHPTTLKVFEFLQPVLTKTETLHFLEKGSELSVQAALLYVKRLVDYGQVDQAIEELEAQIKSRSSDFLFKSSANDLYELSVELAQKHQTSERAQIWCKLYIQNISDSRSLVFAIREFPAYQAWFETILAERSAAILLNHLEKEDRILEAAALFDKYPNQHNLQAQAAAFYARHKTQFPKKGLKALENMLEDHLNYTGDDAYRATAQVLLDIRSIEPKVAFEQRLAQIKEQFKRRRNMMKILEEFGL